MNSDSSIDPNLRDAIPASQPPQQYPSPADTTTNATRLPPPPNPQSPYHQPPQQPYAPYPPDGAYHPTVYYGPPPGQQYGQIQPPNGFHVPAPAPTQLRPAPPGHHYVSSRGADAKRLRACEACRGLKVRCEPDPNGGPCKRCLKAGRKCEITPPSRKRQKKTDSRVSELEKQLADIQAQLKMRAQIVGSESDGEQDGEQYGDGDGDGDGNGNGNGDDGDLTQFETPDRHRASQPPYAQARYGALAAEMKAPLPYVSAQTAGQKRIHAEMVQNGAVEAHMYGPPSHNAPPAHPTESHALPLPEENMLASVRIVAQSMDDKLGVDLLSQYLKTGLPPESSLDTAISTKFELLRRSKPVLFVAIMVIMLQARCKDGTRDSESSGKGEAPEKQKNHQALHVLSEAAMGNRGQVGSNGKGKNDGAEKHDPRMSNPANAFIERLQSVDVKKVGKETWFEEVLQGFQ